jgi:hypothetical protein
MDLLRQIEEKIVINQSENSLLVVCAARYEPVSTCNSLLSGKLTGNFTIFGILEVISVRKTPVLQPLFGKFPTQINRENIFDNREISGRNREILHGVSKARKRPFLGRLFFGYTPTRVIKIGGTIRSMAAIVA